MGYLELAHIAEQTFGTGRGGERRSTWDTNVTGLNAEILHFAQGNNATYLDDGVRGLSERK
jgi:hypothetical protein